MLTAPGPVVPAVRIAVSLAVTAATAPNPAAVTLEVIWLAPHAHAAVGAAPILKPQNAAVVVAFVRWRSHASQKYFRPDRSGYVRPVTSAKEVVALTTSDATRRVTLSRAVFASS